MLTSIVLETEGFNTKTFPSGEEALRFLEDWRGEIALALLDITLQGRIDGFEVCRRMRSDPHTSRIPVLFFTANSTIENRTLAREAGGQGFLAKPFSYEELLREVKRVTAPRHDGQP